MQNTEQYNILMLEHDEDDRFITSSVISNLGLNIKIQFVSDAASVFQYLERSQGYPDMIILDIVLPSGSGLEVLKKIKEDTRYKHIPTLVVSGSLDTDIIMECYKAGANSFFSKPFTDKVTTEKIHLVMNYWFRMAEIPGRPARTADVTHLLGHNLIQ